MLSHSLLKLSPPNYLPNWNTISAKVLEKTKLIYLTYPNNPTGSTATQDDFDEAIHRFKGTQTKIVHDFAYSAFGFDAKNPSILASKMQKMLLSRYSLYLKVIICQAFVLGLLLVIKMIQALKKYQTHTNAGMFGALQDAATYALNHYDEF